MCKWVLPIYFGHVAQTSCMISHLKGKGLHWAHPRTAVNNASAAWQHKHPMCIPQMIVHCVIVSLDHADPEAWCWRVIKVIQCSMVCEALGKMRWCQHLPTTSLCSKTFVWLMRLAQGHLPYKCNAHTNETNRKNTWFDGLSQLEMVCRGVRGV